MSHVFVIAEAGISHDGDLRKALTLVDHAKSAKADAVKFQSFNAQKLAARRKSPDLFAKLKPYEMPLSWLPILKDHCDKTGIEFMTTCFDEETLKEVAPLVKRFKIAASEGKSKELIEAHLEYRRETIISNNGGFNPYPAKYLHCVSKYPTPVSEVCLKDIYNNGNDGFSDHTRNVMMGAFAVCAGAQIVEVHFRDYYTNHDNLDWCVSLAPEELRIYITLIRQAQSAVYGADSEETKKLERPGSAPHTSRPQASAGSSPSGGPQGESR